MLKNEHLLAKFGVDTAENEKRTVGCVETTDRMACRRAAWPRGPAARLDSVEPIC